MDAAGFEQLGRRAQIGRLSALTRAALAEYGLADAPPRLVGHLYNTVFKVATPSGPCALRVNRPNGKTVAHVRSEVQWLAALRRATRLGVPEPVPTRGGDLVAVASAPGVPEPRVCVLLRWVPGRFLYRALQPAQLERVGAFAARLHEHAESFVPPPGFTREPIGLLTEELVQATAGMVAERETAADAAAVEAAAQAVWRTRDEYGGWSGGAGLIHGDLHHLNYLFHGDEVHAIDFDDCGVGPFLYDLAVTVAALSDHARCADLRAAVLRGYLARRALPVGFEAHLDALIAQRRIEGIYWRLRLAGDATVGAWTVAEAREMLRAVRSFAARSQSPA